MRLPAIALSFAALALSAQGRLAVTTPRVDIGIVDAAGGPVPFTLKIQNTGTAPLRLDWVEASHSLSAEIQKGILAPGEVGAIRGSLLPRKLAGPFHGRIRLRSEDAEHPLVDMDVVATVHPDVTQVVGTNRVSCDGLHWGERRTLPELVFQSKSGEVISPASVSVQGPAWLLTSPRVDGNRVTIRSDFLSSYLPLESKGSGVMVVSISDVEYPVTVAWARKTPLSLSRTGETFRLASLDGKAVKVLKAVATPGEPLRMKKDKDGWLIEPSRKKHKPITGLVVTTDHPLAKRLEFGR